MNKFLGWQSRKMRFRWLKLALILILVSLNLGCSVKAAVNDGVGARVVPTVFESAYQQLSSATSIPVLLPTSMPPAALRSPDSDLPEYTSIDLAEADAYEVNFDATPDCFGAGYCNFGFMGAERMTADTESVDQRYAFYLDPNYQPIKRSEEPISEVQLADGITGIFIPWVCGANCNTAKVYWEQDGIRYYVGIRLADRATVVEIANSMIENQTID